VQQGAKAPAHPEIVVIIWLFSCRSRFEPPYLVRRWRHRSLKTVTTMTYETQLVQLYSYSVSIGNNFLAFIAFMTAANVAALAIAFDRNHSVYKVPFIMLAFNLIAAIYHTVFGLPVFLGLQEDYKNLVAALPQNFAPQHFEFPSTNGSWSFYW
jgi:hypothetical protein